jgi:glutaredoxin-like protein
MSDEVIKVYGTDWCGDCRQTRRFLDRHAIPYQWINIDHNPAAEAFVRQMNHGNRSVPTIVLLDGRVLVEPSNQQLEKSLLPK